MPFLFHRTLALLAIGLGLAQSAKGDEKPDNPHLWKPQVKTVAIFKNGYGFFLRSGETKLRDGWCVSSQLPPAVFSTLAIYAQEENDTVDMIGTGQGEVVEFDGRDAGKEAAVKRARLEACKGLKVTLTYSYKGSDRTASGEVAAIGPEFAVLEHDGNNSAVPIEGLKKLQVLDLPLRIHVARSDAAKKDASLSLGMAYLRTGITWIPEYGVRVLDDATAEITLRGTLVNEAEDLIHTDVQFVVGVPHFLYGGHLEPVSIGQVIRTIGSAVAPPAIQTQIMNQGIFANNSMKADQFAPDEGVVEKPVGGPRGNIKAATGNLPLLEGPGAASDFTVYSKPDVTLRRGEKAVVTLFKKKVKYIHRYRWEPPAQLVHHLVLQNDTDAPFTTGPFVAVSGSQPLSQDLLKYTPKGGQCELLITTAVNVATDKSEGEVDRKIQALADRDRAKFDLVTLAGLLKIRNFEKRPAEVLVVLKVMGKPLSASDEGRIVTNAEKLVLTEREGTITWTVKVPPGETKKLEYKYERYVRTP
jgi:hypothetical protein